jgi:AcrR family transcriptional regulator
MPKSQKKRLPPEQRKAIILRAALTLLSRQGLEGFTLEAVAREAGVALSLPRHYFGGTRELLKAATHDLLIEVEQTLLSRDIAMPLPERFAKYLGLLQKNPWGHSMWMRSIDTHPDIDQLVRSARVRMSEGMYRKPWIKLTTLERLDALGRIGYIEAIVSAWIEDNFKGTEFVHSLILKTIAVQTTAK